MTVCTYDNPETMAREFWKDGKLLCHYNAVLFRPFSKEPIPAEYFFSGPNVWPWKEGRIVGDESAIGKSEYR